MRIADLPRPVTAAKVDWLPGTTWLGFSPQGKKPDAREKCASTIQAQFGDGFVLERVSSAFGAPNPGFENHPRIAEERKVQAEHADALIHVHKLRAAALPLTKIIGEEEFEWLQDVWAKPNERHRWSVAFPIVQRFEIIGAPKAKHVFSSEVWTRLFHSQSAGLRRLDDEARKQIADLEIREIEAPNYWIAIEQEIQAAELSDVSAKCLADMKHDLRQALEGEAEERKVKLIRHAAKFADDFVKERIRSGVLRCDDCKFDPASRPDLSDIKARSCFDVHHKNPLAEGRRLTSFDDLALLCPTCHRLEHLRLRQVASRLSNTGKQRHEGILQPEGTSRRNGAAARCR